MYNYNRQLWLVTDFFSPIYKTSSEQVMIIKIWSSLEKYWFKIKLSREEFYKMYEM